MLEGIELIIFDLDGVLIDSKEAVYFAATNAFKKFGIKITKKQLDENIKGRGAFKDFENLVPEKDPVKKRALLAEVVELFDEEKTRNQFLDKLKLNHGAKELLKELKRKGYLICLLTNSNRLGVEAILFKFGLVDFWDKIITKDDGFEKKEDALWFLMEEFEVSQKQTVYIGDMILDIKAARKVGCKIIAKPGWDTKETLKKEKPDFLIDGLNELTSND